MKSKCSNCDAPLILSNEMSNKDTPRMCNSCQVLIMARDMSPIDNVIEEAIRSSRLIQQFCDDKDDASGEASTIANSMIYKVREEFDLMSKVNFTSTEFNRRIRKHVLQVAAIAIAALEAITDEENNYIAAAIADDVITQCYPAPVSLFEEISRYKYVPVEKEKPMTAYITDENNYPAAIEYAMTDKKATYYRLRDGALLLYDQKVDKGYKLSDAAKTSTGLMFFVLDWFKLQAPKFGPAKDGSVGGTIKCMRLSKFLSGDPALISVESIWMPADAEYWPDGIKTMISFDK